MRISTSLQGLILKTSVTVLGPFKKDLRVTFYLLNINFVYIQVVSSYIKLMSFFFSFPRKFVISFSSLFFVFYLFILQKDFDIFHLLLSGVLLCVFDNNYWPSLYVQKIVKKIFFLFALKNKLWSMILKRYNFKGLRRKTCKSF